MNILKSKHIKSFREKLLKEQNYIDPITNEVITNGQMDHSHNINEGYLRKVLTRESNMLLGKIENYYHRYLRGKNLPITLPDILRNIAIYLEQDYSKMPIHHKHINVLISRFSNLKKEEQELILKEKGLIPGVNNKIRCKQYRKLIQNET